MSVMYVRVRVKETGDHIDVPEQTLEGPEFDDLYVVLEGYPKSNYDRRPAFKIDLTSNGREPEIEVGGTVDVDFGDAAPETSGDTGQVDDESASTPDEGKKKKG